MMPEMTGSWTMAGAEMMRVRVGKSPRFIGIEQSMVTQAFELPGYRATRSVGVCRGIVVRSRSIVGNFLGAIQTIFGGDISIYRNLCEQARDEAFRALIQEAESRGANALIGMRYESNEVMAGVTEVLAYGTAVVVEPIEALDRNAAAVAAG